MDNVHTNEMVNGYDRNAIRAKIDVDVSAGYDREIYSRKNTRPMTIVVRIWRADPVTGIPPNPSQRIQGSIDLDMRTVDRDFKNHWSG